MGLRRIMVRTAFISVAIGAFVTAANGQRELTLPKAKPKTHELQSKDGKSINVEILAVTANDAKVRRGSKEFRVPMAKFSDKSQAYLKKWGQENISYSFDVESAHRLLSSGGGVHHYGYEVEIESRVSVDLKDVKIKYQVYNTVNEMRKGDHRIGVWYARRDITFKTTAGSRTKDKILWRWDGTFGSKGRIGNHLGGIWLRIYHKGKMVHEHKRLGSKVRGARWEG